MVLLRYKKEFCVTMKFYYSAETAPLKFHKAFYKVLSPIFICIRVILFLSTIIHLANPDSYYDFGMLILSLLFSGVEIVFLSLIAYGFANKKDYAWYMVYAFLVETVLSGIINAMQSPNTTTAVGEIIGAFIIPILIGIYYYKRKPIFVQSEFNDEVNEKTDEAKSEFVSTTYTSQKYTASPSMEEKATPAFCRKCGNKLTSGSVFCNKCGSKVSWN